MIFGTICCLGDSLTFGARSILGYPEWLSTILNGLDGETEWSTLNRGISKETTRQILARTPAATRELAGLPGASWMVVLAGTNDSKPGSQVTVDEWEMLYRQILAWPRRYKIPILLCTFPPINPAEMPVFTDRSQAWLSTASERVVSIADELNDRGPSPVRCVELRDMSPGFLKDGVHLTPKGYHWLAHRIANGLGFEVEEPQAIRPRRPTRRVVDFTTKKRDA